MTWNIEFLEEAKKDLKKLDHSVQLQVVKGIEKVRKNPLPTDKGGYGKPLGNKNGINLTNLLKIKFRDLGIRVVYKLEYVDDIMKIIVISARTDEAVYKEFEDLMKKAGCYFVSPEEKEKLKFEREYLLSSKPMAIDVLIIKKKYATTLLIIRKKGFIM